MKTKQLMHFTRNSSYCCSAS